MKTSGKPQLALRLEDGFADADTLWRAGGCIAYLGGVLRLRLDTDRRLPERVGDELHLPLPPKATPRQIRDAAESWLRGEAQRVFSQKSSLVGRCTVRVVLSFGKRGDWVRREGELLRCHWRLIEQPLPVIEQVIARALAQMPAPACADLFVRT